MDLTYLTLCNWLVEEKKRRCVEMDVATERLLKMAGREGCKVNGEKGNEEE